MLYLIDNKCYINIAPSIYVEVKISQEGGITPTNNKIEVNSFTKIKQTTLNEELKKLKETEPSYDDYMMERKYNKRKK